MERSSRAEGERKQPPRRRSSGDGEPRRVGRVIRQAAAGPAFAEGLLLGRLVRGWSEVVGTDLAARCRPAALESRSLLVAAESAPWAARVRFAEAEIRRRANEHLGREAVSRLRVTVRPPGSQNP